LYNYVKSIVRNRVAKVRIYTDEKPIFLKGPSTYKYLLIFAVYKGCNNLNG